MDGKVHRLGLGGSVCWRINELLRGTEGGLLRLGWVGGLVGSLVDWGKGRERGGEGRAIF